MRLDYKPPVYDPGPSLEGSDLVGIQGSMFYGGGAAGPIDAFFGNHPLRLPVVTSKGFFVMKRWRYSTWLPQDPDKLSEWMVRQPHQSADPGKVGTPQDVLDVLYATGRLDHVPGNPEGQIATALSGSEPPVLSVELSAFVWYEIPGAPEPQEGRLYLPIFSIPICDDVRLVSLHKLTP